MLKLRLFAIILATSFAFSTVDHDAHADEAAATATTTPPPAEDFPRPSLGLCVGFAAGGVAALAAGIGLGIAARQDASAQTGNPGNPSLYTPHLHSEAQQGQMFADVGYAFMAAGGALLIADIVMWIERARRHPARHVETTLLSPKPSVSVSPAGLQVSF